MDTTSDMQSLSVLDLDVEMLEERIEMATLIHPLGFICFTNDQSCHGYQPPKNPQAE